MVDGDSISDSSTVEFDFGIGRRSLSAIIKRGKRFVQVKWIPSLHSARRVHSLLHLASVDGRDPNGWWSSHR